MFNLRGVFFATVICQLHQASIFVTGDRRFETVCHWRKKQRDEKKITKKIL